MKTFCQSKINCQAPIFKDATVKDTNPELYKFIQWENNRLWN